MTSKVSSKSLFIVVCKIGKNWYKYQHNFEWGMWYVEFQKLRKISIYIIFWNMVMDISTAVLFKNLA